MQLIHTKTREVIAQGALLKRRDGTAYTFIKLESDDGGSFRVVARSCDDHTVLRIRAHGFDLMLLGDGQ